MASWKCLRQDGGFSSQSRRRDDIIFVDRYRQYWGSTKAKSLRTIVDSNHYPDVKWGKTCAFSIIACLCLLAEYDLSMSEMRLLREFWYNTHHEW